MCTLSYVMTHNCFISKPDSQEPLSRFRLIGCTRMHPLVRVPARSTLLVRAAHICLVVTAAQPQLSHVCSHAAACKCVALAAHLGCQGCGPAE